MKPTKKRRPVEEKPAPASYSSLPFEIRLDVYELVLSNKIHRAFCGGDHWPSGLKFSFYGLLLTNRQVYSETQPIAHKQFLAQLQKTHQT